MKTISAVLPLLALATSTLSTPLSPRAQTASVSYDPKYDAAGSSLTSVACSNGENGLITAGFDTFGSLPSFPRIGGAPTISGWNSPNCGKCYELHYQDANVDKSIYVIAVDAAPGGFNLAQQAMNDLTNGQAVDLGRVDATFTEADPASCGFES